VTTHFPPSLEHASLPDSERHSTPGIGIGLLEEEDEEEEEEV